MRQKGLKRLFVLVLTVCLVAGVLPNFGSLNFGSIETQAAVEDVDEYGHKAEIPDSFVQDQNNNVNPYGQGGVNFNPVMELGIFQSDGNTVAALDSGDRLKTKLFSTNDIFPFRVKDDFYSSAGITKSGSGKNLKWASGVALDAEGSGRKAYSAYYGFDLSNNSYTPTLSFYKKGNTENKSQTMSGNYSWMSSVSYDTSSGFNSIVAGDFNNDGKETVVLYDPNKGNLMLREYDDQGKSKGSFDIGNNDKLIKLFGKSLNWIASIDTQSKSQDRNIARVNLTAANVDGQDGDELIVTVSLGDLAYVDSSKLEDRSSVLLVLKRDGQSWKITYSKQMSNIAVSGKNNDHSHDGTGGWYMRSASSDVGDIDGDGVLEIVTVGTLADDRNHSDDDIRTDGTFAVITECGGSYNTQTQGYFLPKAAAGGDYIGYASDKYAQMGPVSLACVQFDGIKSQEYIVVRGEIFYLGENGFSTISGTQMQCVILNNVHGAYRPVVGNFDNNEKGREQIFWVQVHDKKNLQIAGYYYSGSSSLEDKLKDNKEKLRSCRYGIPGKTVSNSFVALTAVDVDNDDGMIVKYNSQQYTYAEPEVMAILEAAPYFSDVADNVGYFDSTGSTSFGVSQGSSSSSSSSSSTRAGAYVSFEQDFSFFGVKIASVEAEASYQAEWSSEVSMETSYTYEMQFNGHQEDNSVVLIYTPVIIYSYDVWNNKTKSWEEKSMDVSVAQKPEYKIITVDEYNEAAAVRGDQRIGDDILTSTPGRPETYRQNTNGLRNCVSASNTYIKLGTGSSSTQSTVTKETSSSITTSLTHSFDAKAGAGAGGVTIGASAGYSSSKATTETNTEGVIRSGEVADVPKGCGNYSFEYKFATWDTTFKTGTNTYTVPVLGYVVKNVEQPPHLPVDVNAVSYSNKVNLDWKQGPIPAKTYEVYRYSEAELGGKQYFRVGTVDGSENPLAFSHENLEEGTIYEYSFRSVGTDGSRSVYSKPIPVMTTASEGVPEIIEQPVDTSVLPGHAATFSIKAVPADINGGLNYAWQRKDDNSSAWYNIEGAEDPTYTIPAKNVTLGMDGTQYRCLISDWGNKQKPVFLYSDAATLSVGLAGSEVSLRITKGSDNQEIVGAETDHGYADYVTTTNGTKYETVSVYYEVTVGNGSNSETITCEKYAGSNGKSDIYYCMDDNKYYTFTGLSVSGSNINGSQNRLAIATAKHEWKQLDNYLIHDTGNVVGNTSDLDSEVPVTEVINEATYEVWTATGVIDSEEKILTLYRATQGDASDKFFYLKDDSTSTLIEMTGRESYTDIPDDQKNHTYLSGTLSQSKAEKQEDGYKLYDLKLSETETIRLYEKVETDEEVGTEDIFYKKEITSISDESTSGASTDSTVTYVEYGRIYQGYFGQISENSVTLANITKPATSPETTIIQVPEKISTSHAGEMVRLTANVSSSGNNTNNTGRVTFNIVNTTTGEEWAIKAVTNNTGEAIVTWTPATAGVYNITASFAGSSTAKAKTSTVKVYYALENDTTNKRYDLELPDEVQYGDSVTPGLYEWNVSNGTLTKTYTTKPNGYSWKVYSSLEGSEESDENRFSQTPVSGWNPGAASLLPGYYMITVENDNDSKDRLVSKCLRVNKREIIITAPEIGPVDVNNMTSFNLSDHSNEIKVNNKNSVGSIYALDNRYKALFELTCNVNKESPIVGNYDINVAYVEDESKQEIKNEFLDRYIPEFNKGSLKVTTSLYTVRYEAGTNGTLYGYNATLGSSGFNSGRAIASGSNLIFNAKPNAGFKVDEWTVKEGDQDPKVITSSIDGYQLNDDDTKTALEVDSLSDKLEVSVTFVNENYSVRFSAGDHGNITAKQGTKDINSGTQVAGGSSVEFTATPVDGYVVEEWTVQQGNAQAVTRKNEDGSNYVGNTLTLDNISSDITVNVTFEQSVMHHVIYKAVDLADLEGTGATGIKFTAEGLDEAGYANKGSEVVLKAELESGVAILEWQTSTDNGETWTTKARSQNTFTIYNLQQDMKVRVIINNTNSTQYDLQYMVCNEAGAEITEPNINAGKLTAKSRGITLNKGNNVAYIPIDFTFTEAEDYEVVKWLVNDQEIHVDVEDNNVKEYHMDSLSGNTTVKVVVRKKSKVTISSIENGTVNVECKLNGRDVDPTNNGYVYQGTKLTVTLTPNHNYIVDQEESEPVDMIYQNTDSTGERPDEMYYETTVTNDIEIKPVFKEKPVVTVTNPNIAEGTVRVTYVLNGKTVDISSGGHVYEGTELTVTLTPAKGYQVDQESSKPEGVTYTYTDNTGTTTDAMSYTTKVNGNITIQPAFKLLETVKITYDTVITTGDNANGTISASTSRKLLYKDDLLVIGKEGNDVAIGNDVTFTASPVTGYRVQYWKVNGDIYTTEDDLTYTGNELTISAVSVDQTVTVQFVPKGDRTVVEVGSNGRLTSAVVNGVDLTGNITNGIVLSPGVSVTITVTPDTGYRVKEWTVNNTSVNGSDGSPHKGNIYTYKATDKAEVIIRVTFEQIDYQVSWGSMNNSYGTVEASSQVVQKYDGTSAMIQGGTEVIFTAKPSTGYQFDGWMINGTEVSGGAEATEDVDSNTLTWTVPSGALLTPKVSTFTVVARYVKQDPPSYTITFADPKIENEIVGTLTATANGKTISSGDKVTEDTTVYFRVNPESGYQVIGWTEKVIGWTENGMNNDSTSYSYSTVIKKNTNVSVILVKSNYNVKYEVTPEDKGTISVSGGRNGVVSVGYGRDVTFNATPNQYYYVKEWKLDRNKVTNGVSEDGNSLTLSNVTANHTVEAVFAKSISYEVSYGLSESADPSQGTVSAKIDGTTSMEPGETANVEIDSKLTFIASPEKGESSSNNDEELDDIFMIKSWKVNGVRVANNLSKTLTIKSLLEKTDVSVEFEPYVGFNIDIPNVSGDDESGEGSGGESGNTTPKATIENTKRVPDDTYPSNQIRRDGDVTFTMKPAEGNTFKELKVYGVDCVKAQSGKRTPVQNPDPQEAAQTSPVVRAMSTMLFATPLGETNTSNDPDTTKTSWVTVTKNRDNSYTIKIENVQQELKLQYEVQPASSGGGGIGGGGAATPTEKPITDENTKISVVEEQFIYDGKEQVPKQIEVTVDGEILKEEDYDVTYENNVNAGTAIIKVTGKNQYTGTVTSSYTIEKRNLKITADNLKKIYGEADPELTYGMEGLVEGDLIDVKLTRQEGENTGEYKILVEAEEKDHQNYHISCEDGVFTINKKDLKITANNLQKRYGDTDPKLTYGMEGLVKGDTISVKLARVKGENPGNYKIVVTAGKNDNYKITCKNGIFTIKDYKNPLLTNALNKGMKVSWKGNVITVGFGKVSLANGYDVFVQRTGKKYTTKSVVSVKNNTKTTATIRKIAGKKPDSRKSYKVLVKAYRLVNGKKEYIATSRELQFVGSRSRWTNAKKVTVKKASVSLTVGKSTRISATTKKEKARKRLYKGSLAQYRYWSTDTSIATVTTSGIVIAKKRGTCYIYVMAPNGKKASVKVVVK